MQAQSVNDVVLLRLVETLPDGVTVLTVDMADYAHFIRSPMALRFNGRLYGRSGWNSDRHVAYYRSDVRPAFAADW